MGNDFIYRNMGRIIHTVAWCILFGLPFFFTGRESTSVTVESYTRFVVGPLSFMLVFYAYLGVFSGESPPNSDDDGHGTFNNGNTSGHS